MNRIMVGALAALLLVSAGIFWWQGRAELARGVPPPDISATGPANDAPITLPTADAHGRGATLPGAAKSVQSDEQKRFNRYDKNRDGRISRNEMLSTRVKAFQKLDTNHDNLLSFEEWAVKTSDRFGEMDRNGDGIITRDEFDAYQAAHPKKPRKPGCGPDHAAIDHRAKGALASDGDEGEPGT